MIHISHMSAGPPRPNVTRGGGGYEELADKMGVVNSIGRGPRPTRGFVHRLKFCLKLAGANLSNIE